MSQGSDPDTPTAAGILSDLRQPQQSLFLSVEGLVQFNAALHDLDIEIADAKADADANNEQQAFMGLPPSGDDDSVFSVGAESQFSDSTPQAPDEPVLNLQQKLTKLCTLRDSLSSKILENGDKFFQELQANVGISVYGNHPIVAVLGKGMLVPMLSFYGVATKETIAEGIKPNISAIRATLHEMTQRLFTSQAGFTPVLFPDSAVDCTMPTAANMVWNVRLTLNGNIFTLLTFRIVAMTNVNVEPQQSPLSPQNHYIHLCFALLSKACAKDFNCLCSMPEIDVGLFNIIVQSGNLAGLILFIRSFLENLAEPQLDSKRSYMLTALHNLVSSFEPSQTGETLAYKNLFDGDTPGSGLNTFNPIMREINKVILILRKVSAGGEELQVSLCGGRMIYKLGDVLRGYTQDVAVALGLNADLLAEMKKPLNLPSDSDYTYSIAGISGEDPDFVQTRLMFYTFCSQLCIKKIIDDFCTSDNLYAGFFLKERVVVGMSLVGGDFQLSSARNSCEALAFLDEIKSKIQKDPSLEFLHPSLEFLQQLPRDPKRVPKSSLAPCDLVPKMPSGDYIKKIAGYIFGSGYVNFEDINVFGSGYVNSKNKKTTKKFSQIIKKIANRISRYSMSTDEGFSSPIKVLFDIFFTLFSIENFTNRAFVTQKINKELKRIGICASILFFHFNELLQVPYPEGSQQHINELLQAQQSYQEGSPQRQQIDTELLQFQQRLLYPEGSQQHINELLQAQQSYQEGSLQRQLTDTELLQFQQRLLYPEGSPQRREITTMLEILGRVINYGYNPAFKLLSAEIDNIMTAYASCFVQLLHLYHLGVVFYSQAPVVTLPPIGGRSVPTSLETRCMYMLRVQAPVTQAEVPTQALAPYQGEGLSDAVLQSILTTGLQFLYAIQTNHILQYFLQLKQKVKTKDSEYKAEGKFLTSVEAFEFFLQGFPKIEQPFPKPALPALRGFVAILTHSTLLNDLQPLLNIFHSDSRFAELMHFEPIVVIKSENLKVTAKANPANAEGLKVSGQHQFGIYALLSIFGVKFKSEWSKIALFTRMLFRELFSHDMNHACQSLLGVNLGNIDPTKYRTSYENYEKDVALYLVLQRLGIAIESLPLLSTYYGRGNVHHGVNVYFNPVTAATNFQFIFPDNPQPNDELLSFRFLSPEILQSLGVDAFGQLLAQGALQPRAYEFLVDRLLQKFSNLTKECDENVTKDLKEIGHGGRPSKDIKVQRKLGEVDAFIGSLIPLSQQQPNSYNEFISALMASPLSACFEGKKDADKFEMLSNEQRMQWLEHLTSMITFLITYPNTDTGHQRLLKYSKLLLLLKKYIPPPPQAAVQQAAMQAAPDLSPPFPPASKSRQTGSKATGSTAPATGSRVAASDKAKGGVVVVSSKKPPPQSQSQKLVNVGLDEKELEQTLRHILPSRAFPPPSSSTKGQGKGSKRQGGGSPKAFVTKPKTRNNNRYSKNARTRKNKHKRKQHRNRKYKKTTNTKSNRRTKSQSKKNVTFKRRRR
jgi:hypothetical protein